MTVVDECSVVPFFPNVNDVAYPNCRPVIELFLSQISSCVKVASDHKLVSHKAKGPPPDGRVENSVGIHDVFLSVGYICNDVTGKRM
jgi:hypothetical protein